MDHRIRKLELSLLDAWPATDRVTRRGWVFNANGGYTRRANTAVAVGPDASEIILDDVEDWYGARGQPSMLRTTPLTPGSVIETAIGRGYRWGGGSCHVMVRDGLGVADEGAEVTLRRHADREWWSLAGRSGQERVVLADMCAALGQSSVFATGMVGGRVAAIGQGVVARGFVHLFSVHTRPEYRGRGLASAVMAALETWGARSGAAQATLQVTIDNDRASRLYVDRGYRTIYRYDYLVEPPAG